MSRAFSNFVFYGYHFDKASKTLKLQYGFDDQLKFTEEVTFDFPLVNYDQQVFDRACQNLFFMAGVSYYKAYQCDNIRIDHGQLDSEGAKFFADVYQKGLGEYYYLNKLDPQSEIPFAPNSPTRGPVLHKSNGGLIIGIGGGKDSLVSAELLRNQPKVATWSMDHRSQLEPLIKQIGLPHLWVSRKIDPLIVELNSQDALNGHIPISAIWSCVGTIVCVLAGYRDSVVSNEYSANEPTLEYSGVKINHQYSKSSAYEQAYQQRLTHCFGDSLRYYSFLRPLSEIRIAEVFARVGFDKYKLFFSSCNRAFVQSSDKMSWCGKCPKCAFTFLALSPFVDHQELEKLWHKNLLTDPFLVTTYENLLGIDGDKPLDCVGEVKESRQAMRLAQNKYPGLNYDFDVPANYDYQKLALHNMPPEVFELFFQKLKSLL